MRGPSSSGCSPQPSAPTTASTRSSPEQPVRLDEHLQVLARLERRDGEHVRRAEVGGRPVGPKRPSDAGCATRIRSSATPSVCSTSRPVYAEFTNTRSHVARGVPVLPAVHRPRPRGRPLRMMQRDEVVDRRRAHAGSLRRVHPVREVEHVEGAEEALGGRATGTAPGRAQAHARTAAARSAARRRCPRAPRGSAPGRGCSSARTRRSRARRPPPRRDPRASPGCSCRSRAAGARAG